MIDIFNNTESDLSVQVFYVNSGSWQTWVKPRNCRFISIYMFGGGGGGGGGFSGANGTNRGGGGGGGSASLATGFFTSEFLPDILFVQVGAGGVGGAANNAGGSGEFSHVSIRPDIVTGNVIMRSGETAGPAAGGAAGTSLLSGGGGGAGGTVATPGLGLINFLGQCSFTAGQSGNNGGYGAIGNSITVQLPITAGAGGGGTSTTTAFAGGNITGVGIIPTINGGAAGGTTVADNGYVAGIPSIGTQVARPPFFTGGAGGGAVANGVGSVGGNGAYGSGGGGGGAGTTGGKGGDGGNGLVIIAAW